MSSDTKVAITEPETDQSVEVPRDGAEMLALAGYIVKCTYCGDYHANDTNGITFEDVLDRIAEAGEPS